MIWAHSAHFRGWLVSGAGLAIMRYWKQPEGQTLQIPESNRYAGNGPGINKILAILVAPLALLMACEGPSEPVAAESTIATSIAPESFEPVCGQDGRLAVELYGGIRATIDWQASDLSCTGMPRPAGEGARIRLSGPIDTGIETRKLAFILGLPGLKMGQTGAELPTNVTLIEEGTGRFFGTRDESGCWTDVTGHEPIGDDSNRLYRIEGTLYCVSPLAELNGNTSVTFTELKFTGRLNWEQPE